MVLAGLADGRKVILALKVGHRESEQRWWGLLRDLKDRGLGCARLLIADGHLALLSAWSPVFPNASEQRCWKHKVLTALDRTPRRLQSAAKPLLAKIPNAETRAEAAKAKAAFRRGCQAHGCAEAA